MFSGSFSSSLSFHIYIYYHKQTLIEHYSSLNNECLLDELYTVDISLSCLVCSCLVEKEGISLVLK